MNHKCLWVVHFSWIETNLKDRISYVRNRHLCQSVGLRWIAVHLPREESENHHSEASAIWLARTGLWIFLTSKDNTTGNSEAMNAEPATALITS